MLCKEEVFNWFKDQSGAKRIELMCGLMSMCIPLEIRFFESIIKELAKKDMNALREAEIKANSYQELDNICKCDLLADTHVVIESNDLNTSATNCEVQSNAIQSKHSIANTMPSHPTTQMLPQIQDMQSVAPNGTTMMASNDMMGLVPPPTPSPPNSSSHLSQLSSRSKLVVSLCLLSTTNRNCSTIAFKALRQQLTAQQIGAAIGRWLQYRKNVMELDDVFSGLLLLLTMAVHSPAFSFDQRELLIKQKEDVEHTIDSLKFIPNANYSSQPFPAYVHSAPHPGHAPTHIHPHIGPQHPQQAHTPPAGVAPGGPPLPHSHSHAGVGHQSSQYPTHQYIASHSVTNLSYPSAPLPNMTNLRITNMPVVSVSTSPTSSPSTKSSVTSVAAISPLPLSAEYVSHGLSESVPNQTQYVIPSQPQHQTLNDDISCAKSIVSCYNCGSIGHRGDECNSHAQEEANR